MSRSHRTLLGCALAGLLSACGGTEETPRVVVQDSAGVEIVVSAAPAWGAESAAWTLDSAPALELSSDPNQPERILLGISDVDILPDGRIVVANSGSAELFVFDSTGAFLDAWGGRGEGPGEFVGLGSVMPCGGDTLVVGNRAQLAIFGSSGAYVRTEAVAGRLAPNASFTLEGVAPDCSSVLLAVRQTRAPSAGERFFRYPTEVYWAPFDGPAIPVGSFPGNELMTVDLEGTLIGARLPFGVQPVWATDGVRVFYGPADRHEVHVFEAAGGLGRIVRWNAPSEPISEQEWARYQEARQAEIDEDPAGSLMPPRADHPSELRPAYSDLLVDDDGNLWVRAFTESSLEGVGEAVPERWTVFDPEGSWLGELTMPPRFALRSVQRGFAMGVALDELDVPTVQLLRIR
jgi:hypothetical protein